MAKETLMNRRAAALLVVAVMVVLPGILMGAQERGDVQVWLSTADRSSLLALQTGAVKFVAGNAPAANAAAVTGAAAAAGAVSGVVEVNDKAKYQTMDGFGFALTGGSAQLLMKMDADKRAALLKEIFSTDGDGIGVSYLRLSIGASDMNDHVFSYDDLAAGETDVNMAKFDLGQDKADVIPVMKEILAIAPGIKILGSPWSAPAWMKTNGLVKGGELKPEFYGAYANYLVKYVQGMKAEGITIDAITIENEPLNPKNTPSMVVFADEEGAFIAKNLGPAFEKAGIRTKILLYDHNPDVASYPLSILGDAAASKYVDGTALHLYGGDASTFTDIHNAYPDKNLYMTEQSISSRANGPFGIAAAVGRVPIAATRNWSRNVLIWNLAADPNNGPHTNDGGCGGCTGAITLDGNNATKLMAYYALGHFSKFVPPGSVRIASGTLEQLPSVAFLTPSGKIVLVAANVGNFSKTFNVSYHGKTFTATLPSESVATFVW
jgi:glucosylceramidase